MTIAGAIAVVLFVWCTLILVYIGPLWSYWYEPLFRSPVLIFESDDWGPGPPSHAEILFKIASLLQGFKDKQGHHPVISLGLLLAVPKGSRRIDDEQEITLNHTHFSPIVNAILEGAQREVFCLQLHGRSHYWFEALVEAAYYDEAVRNWMTSANSWQSERLPDGLQSRWGPEIGGKTFHIPYTTAREAAKQEAELFRECFGTSPDIAVPPTFVWNPAVEEGWRAAGIRAIVTPGRYFHHRRQFGRRVSKTKLITNGMVHDGIHYIVRDRYFEPYKGHVAADGLRALQENTALGRPTLLETHRINFVDRDVRAQALAAMQELLTLATKTYRDLRFLSTTELVDIIKNRPPEYIERSVRRRFAVWCLRMRQLPRFWRLARLCGLAVLITAAERVARLI